jgi:hypothetical protein
MSNIKRKLRVSPIVPYITHLCNLNNNVSLFCSDAAIIKDAPEFVMVNPGENAHLYCVAEGNPLSESHISWRREGFSDSDMEQRTERSYRNGTSYLVVQTPSREDNGNFYCVVNNGIGNETTKPVYLVVKCK